MPPEQQTEEAEKKSHSKTAGKTSLASFFLTIRKGLSPWPLAGLASAAVWFLILAIGVLIPATEYRKDLGWVPEKVEKTDEQKELSKKVDALIKANLARTDTNGGSQNPQSLTALDQPVATKCRDCPLITAGEELYCPACKKKRRSFTVMFWPFVVASVCYLPLNICLLTLLAAFIGGCALNKGELKDLEQLVDEYNTKGDRSIEAERIRKRLYYLNEHPGYSALRGLIVFLVIVSGLLVAGGPSFILEGSQTEQLTQYFKLAGIFSFFGYLAGSDPTLFASMIEFGSARLRQPAPSPPAAQPDIDAASAKVAASAAATAAAAQITAERATDTVEAVQEVNAAKDHTEALKDEKDEKAGKIPPSTNS